MDLIEQLGGYDVAKEKYQSLSDSDVITIGPFEVPAKPYFKDELLEHRRQHNIFEVGDIAVNSRGDESRLLKIWRVDMCAHNSKMSIADYDAESLGGWSRFHALRHATDAEIKAGKRLEVK